MARRGAPDCDPSPAILRKRAPLADDMKEVQHEGLLVLHLQQKLHEAAYPNPLLLNCLLVEKVEGKPALLDDPAQNGRALQNLSGGLVDAGKT